MLSQARWFYLCLSAVGVSCASALGVEPNLLRNPSFEVVPNSATGQGRLPTDWISVSASADTYSNDGSYGLSPSGFGNFPTTTAHDGLRWVAGAFLNGLRERFGQSLTTPLVPGDEYTLSAHLIQAERSDLDHPGGYDILLTDSVNLDDTRFLGRLEPTTDSGTWEPRALSFVAPLDAVSLPLLVFEPYVAAGAINAYPGIDLVSLQRVVESPGETLVPRGSMWKYLDNGSNQGVAWIEPAFDDAAWPQGPGELGYGDGNEVTTVSFIDTDPIMILAQRNITTYFRHAFDLTAAEIDSIASLDVELLRDDGAAV